MLGLIGKKIGMTSVYNKDGKNIPCTLIEAGPCVITQIKTKEKDGYNAVQMGFGSIKERNISSALKGHFNKAKVSEFPRNIFEFRDFSKEVNIGEVLLCDTITELGFVDVVGTSKGKGFQGVVKRHGFAGVGQRTHGQHNRERAPGSIGGASYPARVFKGMRMAGRMGGSRVKSLNIKVIKVITKKNMLLVKGSVPGFNGSNVIIEQWN